MGFSRVWDLGFGFIYDLGLSVFGVRFWSCKGYCDCREAERGREVVEMEASFG